MRRYLAVYMGAASPEEREARPVDPAIEAAGVKAWQEWAIANAHSIADHGGPLGRTKIIDRYGAYDGRNQMTGYVIVEANSAEDAARLFVDHPHFSILPGERIEVIECLDMPDIDLTQAGPK